MTYLPSKIRERCLKFVKIECIRILRFILCTPFLSVGVQNTVRTFSGKSGKLSTNFLANFQLLFSLLLKLFLKNYSFQIIWNIIKWHWKLTNFFKLFHIIWCTSRFSSVYRIEKVYSSIWWTLFLIFWSARSDIWSASAKLDSLFWEVLPPSALFFCKAIENSLSFLPFPLFFPSSFLFPTQSFLFLATPIQTRHTNEKKN